MRPALALATSLAVTGSIAAFAQQTVIEPGRGLLPRPYATPKKLEGHPAHPYTRDPSGVLARTIFETSDDPNFNIIIKDFTFLPDRQSHTISFPSGVFLHFFDELDYVKIAGLPITFHAGQRTAVAASTPIEVVNSGERIVTVRALIVEAK
jgi:hypothetical protein